MTAGEDTQYPFVKKQRFYYGYVMVIAAMIILMAAQSTRYAFGVFFKPVLTEFGWTRAMTAGAFSFCALVEGVMSIVWGGLTDRLGPRKILTISGILISLGFFLVSRINSIWQFYLFYGVVVGFGMGGVVVPLMPTGVKWFAKRTATMTSIVLSGVSFGALVGPLYANALISVFQWRTAYVIISIFIFVIVVGLAQLLKRNPAQMGLTLPGADESTKQSMESAEGKTLREVFRIPSFWLILTVSFSLGFLANSVTVHLVPNAIDLGISATTAAQILSVAGIMMVIGRLAIGSSADIIGVKRTYVMCLTITAATFIELIWAKEIWMLYLFAMVFGLFEGGATPLVVPALAGICGLKSISMIAGFCGLAMTAGVAAGPTVSGYLFDISGDYQTAFTVCLGIGLVGAVSTLFLKLDGMKKG